jgi:hypothetical protein
VLENVVDKLVATNHGTLCLPTWDKIAPYPKRYPLLTYLLGKLYCDGIFDGPNRSPSPVAVGRVLLHLGRILNEDRKKNQVHSRLLGRLTSLLTGKRGLLHRSLDGISRDDLTQYVGIMQALRRGLPAGDRRHDRPHGRRSLPGHAREARAAVLGDGPHLHDARRLQAASRTTTASWSRTRSRRTARRSAPPLRSATSARTASGNRPWRSSATSPVARRTWTSRSAARA